MQTSSIACFGYLCATLCPKVESPLYKSEQSRTRAALGACSVSSAPQGSPEPGLCFPVKPEGRRGFRRKCPKRSDAERVLLGATRGRAGSRLGVWGQSTGLRGLGRHRGPEVGTLTRGTPSDPTGHRGTAGAGSASSGQERHGASLILKRFILLTFTSSAENFDTNYPSPPLFVLFCFRE